MGYSLINHKKREIERREEEVFPEEDALRHYVKDRRKSCLQQGEVGDGCYHCCQNHQGHVRAVGIRSIADCLSGDDKRD